MEKIKLVQITGDSKMGGGSTHILGILENIDRNKFECYLICPVGFLSKSAKSISGVHIINLPFKSKFDFSTVFALKKELQKIQASANPFAKMIVHAHGPRAGFFSSLAISRNVVMLFTEHNYTKFYRLSNWINNFVQVQMLNFVYRRSNHIIAVSSAVKGYLLSVRVPATQITVIHDAYVPMANKQTRKKNGNPTIGTVGSLNSQKGQIYLIRALPIVLKKYPKAMLEIIGDGQERDRLNAEVNRLGIRRNVSLLGTKTDLQKYFSSWDVFVLPSISETFGIAVLEAMDAGIPVVATRSGGVIDIIKDRVNGLLVERKKPDLLAKAILEILDKPELAEKLKANANQKLHEFSWEAAIRKLEDICQNS